MFDSCTAPVPSVARTTSWYEPSFGGCQSRFHSTQVSWDIDVWGRVSKGVQAQTAEFHATEADWRADVIAIEQDSNGKLRRLEHIVNAIELD